MEPCVMFSVGCRKAVCWLRGAIAVARLMPGDMGRPFATRWDERMHAGAYATLCDVRGSGALRHTSLLTRASLQDKCRSPE